MKFIVISTVINVQITWSSWVDPDCFSMVLKGDRSCLPPKYHKVKRPPAPDFGSVRQGAQCQC